MPRQISKMKIIRRNKGESVGATLFSEIEYIPQAKQELLTIVDAYYHSKSEIFPNSSAGDKPCVWPNAYATSSCGKAIRDSEHEGHGFIVDWRVGCNKHAEVILRSHRCSLEPGPL